MKKLVCILFTFMSVAVFSQTFLFESHNVDKIDYETNLPFGEPLHGKMLFDFDNAKFSFSIKADGKVLMQSYKMIDSEQNGAVHLIRLDDNRIKLAVVLSQSKAMVCNVEKRVCLWFKDLVRRN